MKLTVHIPDELIAEVKDRLPPPEMGMLEAIALDAILGFIGRLKSTFATRPDNTLRSSP
ncbi:hypothetical protein [Bradyrhizobium mercantei]|uniref:hypothetical protein n=1 Tax=Bradyrhizobium mercantei TaxID=1904807 RepID=UPI0013566945|nr:hypothetical protein [Bradyrhizobium mercantei]